MNARARIALAACSGSLLMAPALAAPTLANAAPTVRADLPCYYPGQEINLNGAGYTPGAEVALMLQLSGAHGNTFLSPKDAVRADAAGGLATRLPAPDLASDNDLRETVTLTANDQARLDPGNPAATPEDTFGSTQFLVSNVFVRVGAWFGHRASPLAPAAFQVVGWEPFRKVYAHYFLNHKRLKTIEVGSVSGPCGDLRRTLRQFPFRPVPAGSYTIRFTGTRLFDPDGFWVQYRNIVVPKAKAVR